MTPLREIMPDLMIELTKRSRQAGQEPPAFVTELYDRRPSADKPPPRPPR